MNRNFVSRLSSSIFGWFNRKPLYIPQFNRGRPSSLNVDKIYGKHRAWGMLTSLDIHDCNPEKIRCDKTITRYVDELCKLIDMKKYGDTIVVNFGEDKRVEGYSMVQLIETSCISGHFSNETNSAYIDIFSCKTYNPDIATEFTSKFFDGGEHSYSVLLRGVDRK